MESVEEVCVVLFSLNFNSYVENDVGCWTQDRSTPPIRVHSSAHCALTAH